MLSRSLLLIGLLSFTGFAQKDNLVLVTSLKNELSVIETPELQAIFLGKTRDVTGIEVTPVLLDVKELQGEFVRTFLDRSEIQFTRTWQKLIFTGKGQRPPVFDSIDQLINYLRENKGALSYLPKDKVPRDLKVLVVK